MDEYLYLRLTGSQELSAIDDHGRMTTVHKGNAKRGPRKEGTE
jgi:hypothetical protein